MGGVESFASLITESLEAEYSFSFLAATTDHIAKEDFFKDLGIEVYYLKNIFGIKNALRRKGIIKKFLKENDFDIIHINATTLNATYIAQIANNLGIKVIYHIHNTAPSGYGIVARLLTKYLSTLFRHRLAQLDNIQFVSVSKNAASAVFGDSLPTKIIVNGIDTERFIYDPRISQQMRKKFDLNLDDKIGIVVARLMPIKNYKKVLDIANNGIGKHFDKLFIVGDGPEKGTIQKQIHGMSAEIQNNIIMLGERNDIPNLLNMSDFMLLTSFSEGLSISVIEAQAVGVIPIVSLGVPKITNVTKKVQFLNINDSEEIWLNNIDKVHPATLNRIDMNRIVGESQFSKKNFINKIRDLYN